MIRGLLLILVAGLALPLCSCKSTSTAKTPGDAADTSLTNLDYKLNAPPPDRLISRF